jgi:hypothetical protein
VLTLMAAAVLGLIEAGMDGWLAALVVALVALAIGAGVLMTGVRQVQTTSLAPTQTAETIQENVEFVKETVK